ncbi:Uncharacterised protein [Vibrio cholerae]|nr:Uncharacterised protein [Vibrio cholerae]
MRHFRGGSLPLSSLIIPMIYSSSIHSLSLSLPINPSH